MKAFSSGNRIQQEATAKAMGMSREEMAKMIYAQKIQGGLSAKQAADAADISLEEAKRLSAQESIAKAMEKITQAAANVLDIFAPILSNSLVLGATLTAVALVVAGKLAIGLKDSYSEMKGMVKSSLAFLKNTKLSQALVGKFYKGGQFMKGGGKAAVGGERKGGLLGGLISKVSGGGGTTDKAGGSITKLAKGTEGVKKGQGETIKGFLKGIGGGLSALGKAVKGPQLAYIAAGMGILTLSLMGIGAALGFAAPGIKAFGTVITSIFAGVATVITAVAAGFVMLMDNMTMEKVKPMLALGLALYGIAGGLALMATAGLGALPIIGALGALALVAAPLAQLAGVFGGGGDEGNGGEDKIVKKLDELIDIAKKGTVIMMDGNVVGQTVQRSSSGIGA
jgi:hypothetical protein